MAWEGLGARPRGAQRTLTHLPTRCPDPSSCAAAELDLHFLSVAGAGIVLRAWLLNLRRLALEGRRLPPGATFRIITGGWVKTKRGGGEGGGITARCRGLEEWRAGQGAALPPVCFLSREASQSGRAWLRAKPALPPPAAAGWGRNSANNVPRLKPEVEHMLTHEMGPPLALQEPPSNSGLYNVTAGE